MNNHQQELFFQKLKEQNTTFQYKLPSRHEAGLFIQKLINFLFPISQDCQQNDKSKDMQGAFLDLKSRLDCMLTPLMPQLNRSKEELVDAVFDKIPEVYEMLIRDARSITENDPASVSVEEVIALYPGFTAIATYRVAHSFAQCGIPLLPRMLTEFAHSQTGIDIHPHAVIGHSFFIDHGTGIVIGETTIIGKNVSIYQGVTLGALQVAKDLADIKRHPTVEDNVIIYARTTILGGNTVIGRNSIIGGSVFLTKSIEPYSQVFNTHQLRITPREVNAEPDNTTL